MKIRRLAIEDTLLNEHSQTMHIAMDQCDPAIFLAVLAFVPLFFQFFDYLVIGL